MKRKLFTFAFLMVLLGTVMDFSSVDAASVADTQVYNWIDGGYDGKTFHKVKSVSPYNPGKTIVNVKDGNNYVKENGELSVSMVCQNCGAWIETIGQHDIEYANQLASDHPFYVGLYNNGIRCNGEHSCDHTQSTQIHFKTELIEITAVEY